MFAPAFGRDPPPAAPAAFVFGGPSVRARAAAAAAAAAADASEPENPDDPSPTSLAASFASPPFFFAPIAALFPGAATRAALGPLYRASSSARLGRAGASPRMRAATRRSRALPSAVPLETARRVRRGVQRRPLDAAPSLRKSRKGRRRDRGPRRDGVPPLPRAALAGLGAAEPRGEGNRPARDDSRRRRV